MGNISHGNCCNMEKDFHHFGRDGKLREMLGPFSANVLANPVIFMLSQNGETLGDVGDCGPKRASSAFEIP